MDDRYAINVAKTELREGYKNGDIERILAFFADTVTDMRDGHASFYGVDAKTIRKASLEKLFREHEVELIPIVFGIEIFGDVAIDYGWHEMTLRSKSDGATVTRRTRYIEMWKRDADLGWQIVLFLDNADQKPELTERVLHSLGGAPITQELKED